MSTLSILDQLPSGFFVEESPRGVLALHADVARDLHAAGYGPEHDGDLRQSGLEGRRPLYSVGGAEAELVLRRFSHGGLLRWLTGARYLDPERPFRELVLVDSLLRAGVRTPQVVAGRARMARPFGWTLDVVSRRIPDSVDLGFVLGMVRRGELAGERLQRLVEAVGELVQKLHRHACQHADLTPPNILLERSFIDGTEPRPVLWILDLDRSVLHRHLDRGRRTENLRRLFRYVGRRDMTSGRSFSRSDYARFLRAYAGEGEDWKPIWRAVRSAHGRRRVFHAFGWFLERLFGRRRDPRD
ncbi:MAG: hypothetical protein CMJ84_16210 [Planctomycetes bacterium]|jgi:hypothetical protein|nr:hypothetical protein [Planctomycetota bacterium]MDP6408911.1 lipopolysaccharide kinase InaA family protein [Planctomycetota bacterium]